MRSSAARRMCSPARATQEAAALLGAGDLDDLESLLLSYEDDEPQQVQLSFDPPERRRSAGRSELDSASPPSRRQPESGLLESRGDNDRRAAARAMRAWRQAAATQRVLSRLRWAAPPTSLLMPRNLHSTMSAQASDTAAEAPRVYRAVLLP